MYVDALDREANLTGARDRAAKHGGGRLIEIRGLRDDDGILTTELEHAWDEAACAGLGDATTVLHAAREIDDVDVVDDRLARASIADHVGQDFGQLRHLVDRIHDRVDEAWRDFAGLHDRRAAGDQSRNDVER